MSLDFNRPAGDQELIVFASSFAEAACEADVCEMTFLDSADLPTLSSKSVAYDTGSGKYKIEVNG